MWAIVNISYLLIGILIAPFWMLRKLRAGTLGEAMRGRCGPWSLPVPGDGGRILIHAVSVGEVNAVSSLADRLIAEGRDVVLSVTTETGFRRATSISDGRFPVIRSPLDLSWIVRRYLDGVAPAVVVLVELEVWPNLMAACRRRQLPVIIVNGRISDRSIRRYRWITPLIRGTFRSIRLVLAQGRTSADRFIELGVPADRVTVAGNMKWDAATEDVDDGAMAALATDLTIDRSRLLIVAGSTEPLEHRLLRDALPDGVQLIVAPRRPEWFADAAGVFEGARRRSDPVAASGDVLVLDSIGELTTAYALADIVVVGRSFGDLHGSDPMQPAALRKAIIIGPSVDDFSDAVSALKAQGGICQIIPSELGATLKRLAADPAARSALGDGAHAVSHSQRGATEVCAAAVSEVWGDSR